MAGNKENTTGSSAIPELSRDLAPTTTRSSADEKGDHSDYIKSEGGDDVEKGFPGKKGSVWGAMTSPLRSGAAISTVTEQGDRHVRMQRERTLERQHSVVASFTSPRSPVDPAARVPAEFRTLSIQLSEGGLAEKTKRKKETKAVKDLDDLDWHKLSSAEILTRLGASPSSGLDSQQAKRRLDQYGKNQMSKPPNRWARKAFSYIFGGFGSFLLVASILCFVAWKPLGNPNPQASNLALAIVLVRLSPPPPS